MVTSVRSVDTKGVRRQARQHGMGARVGVPRWNAGAGAGAPAKRRSGDGAERPPATGRRRSLCSGCLPARVRDQRVDAPRRGLSRPRVSCARPETAAEVGDEGIARRQGLRVDEHRWDQIGADSADEEDESGRATLAEPTQAVREPDVLALVSRQPLQSHCSGPRWHWSLRHWARSRCTACSPPRPGGSSPTPGCCSRCCHRCSA